MALPMLGKSSTSPQQELENEQIKKNHQDRSEKTEYTTHTKSYPTVYPKGTDLGTYNGTNWVTALS